MTSDTNTNGKTETKNTKLKLWDSKMRKKNRKTKMDSKKHGEGGRKERKGKHEGRKEGRKEGKKKNKDWYCSKELMMIARRQQQWKM